MSEISSAREELAVLHTRFDTEKSRVKELQTLSREVEETKWAIEQNERRYNVDKAAELRVRLFYHKEQVRSSRFATATHSTLFDRSVLIFTS